MAMAGAAMSEPLWDMSVRFQMLCSLIDFETTCRPVWQLVAGEVGLQPVQERVRATEESGRVADAETAVSEPEQCAVAVGGELVAHHTVLDDRLFPFVFEYMRRIPDQDAAGHPLTLGRKRWARRDHVDGAALTGLDRRFAEPLRPFLRVGDGRPHHLDRKGQVTLEIQHGAVAVHRQPSIALADRDSLCLRSRCRSRASR